eukprot:INCI687.1.p1 GENE.INCI687.1~~INCI687.1.p1  ORF type:complete len:1206 (+),score=177.36 INCI687.1:205-3822(+)
MPNLGVNVQACGSDVTQSDASDNSDSSTLQHMQPTASLDSVLCVDSSRLPRSGSNPASDSDEATKGSSTSSVDNRNGPRRFVTRRSSADDYVEPSRLSDGGAGPFVPPIDLHASSTPPDAAASMSKTPVADPGLGSSERRSTGSGGRDAVERGSHFEAARLISRQLHMNLPIIEQWKRSVEIMNQERSCADPSCRVCRWPRSTIVKVNPCTGEVKCKAMQRKFRENVRIAHFDSILRHLTTMLSCVYVLIGGYVYYNAATSKNLYFLTEERDFTPYPAIARGMVTLCWIITFLTLSFLWGVKLMPQAEACIARCKQRRKGKSGGRLRRQGSFKASRVSNPGNLRRSRHSSGSSSSYGQSLSLQERLYSCTHIGLSPIFVSLVVLSFVAFCFAMFFINMADFQVERLFLHYYFNNSFVLTEDCVQFEAGAILHVNSPNSTTVAPPPNATTYSPITFDPSTHPATTSQANATKLTVSQMLDVLRLCNNKVTVEEPWSALELDHGDDSDGDDDGDGDGSSPVHPQSIGTNTYRGNEEDFSDISYLVVNFLEDQNEVNMFVILLFGKFVALFLMVVHHIEFYYVLVTAVCLDVTAIATGSASISSDYIYFLGTETLFPFWVGVFCFSSVPLILTFGVLQRRAMQQFVVMYANAEDNLRFQRPNIVHDCLHVDTSAKGKIGAGSSGMVFRGRYAGFKVAVKELYSAQMDNNMEESFREAETLARLRHPNIVTFYGIGYSSEQDASTNDLDSVGNSKSFRIITELCSISLDRLLTNKAFHLDERKLCAIGLQIAYGMQYLHSINLEHYDMKPENVLIKKAVRSTTAAKHIHVKIADFGLARLVPMSSRKGASTPLRRGAVDAGWEDMRPAAGTFEYMPPEILRFERNRHVRSVMKARHPHVPLHGLPKVGEESSHRRSMRQLIQPVAATPTSSSNHRAAYALQEALYGSAVQVGSNNNLSQSGFNVLAAGDTPRHTDAMRYDRKKDKAKSSQLRQRSPTRSRTTERDTFSPPFESERPHSPIREGADLVVPYKWDVYSFGVVLWQMHSRKTPFYAATAAEYHSDTRPRTTTTAKIQATPSPPPKQQQAPSSRLPQPHASPEKNIDDSSPHATTLASAVTLALPSPSGEATPQHESKSSGGSIDSFASPNHSSTQMGVSPTSAACDAMMEFASSFADPQPQKLQPQGSGAARGAPAFGADVHPEILKAKKTV